MQLTSSHLLSATLQNKPSGFDNKWVSFIQYPAKTHVDSQQKTGRAEVAHYLCQAESWILQVPQWNHK